MLSLETAYMKKHRLETLPDGSARHRAELSPATQTELAAWDLERIKPEEDVPTGSSLLLAHHAEVTFGNIRGVPLAATADPALEDTTR